MRSSLTTDHIFTVVPTAGRSSASRWRVPARGVDVRLRALKWDILAAVETILDSGIIEKGPYNKQLAQAFQAMCGAPYPGVPCDSGTDALKLALEACGIGPGDEVIVPELSFMSTVSAVHELGATPVFVDIAHDLTFAMDPSGAEAAISEHTRAIVPVHLFGLPVAVADFLRLQERYGLPIIGDAAQAHGAEYEGRRVGNLGFAFETFSLAAVKNIGGWRFGGIVMHRDEDMALPLAQMVDLGRVPGESYQHARHGFRANLDEFNAAVILIQLAHLDEWNAARRAHAAENSARLARFAPAIQVPAQPQGRLSCWWQYCITCESQQVRDRLHRFLRSSGVETAHYPCVLSEQPSIRQGRRPFRVASNTRARDAVSRQLWLPFWPEMQQGDRDYVIAGIQRFFDEGHVRSSLLDA